jgi:NAD(P)-dependent dehydrogenase (short-subunit alcohol dehydrogenase family)
MHYAILGAIVVGKLEDRVAVITGGNSGIGLAMAKLFAAEGAKVVITGRRQQAIDDALREIGPAAVGVQGDIGKLADLDRLTAEMKRRFGAIDVYVANAGVNIIGPFEAVTEEQFDEVFDVNVKGVFFGVQKALPLLKDGASVILVGSIASTKVLEGHIAYAGAKAALRSFARGWTAELKGRKIRVNVLSPGPVKTPIIDKLGLSREQVTGLDEVFADVIPLGRWGRPEELARAGLFLASDDSSFVTGIDLCVDGGMAQV